MASKPRFERAKDVGGAGIDSREGSPADYLARLWTLFGPPEGESDGRAYYSVRDRETGQEFRVSTNALGISYGAALESSSPGESTKRGEALAPMFAAFDALLARTALTDCRLEMQVGDRKIVLGAKNGVPFEQTTQPRPSRRHAIARAEKALAEGGDAGFFYDETVTLLDVAPDARPLLGKLWRRAVVEMLDELERELSQPKPGGMIYPILGSILPRLEETAAGIGIDARAELAPHAATLAAARRALKA
ncbi:MAG TPA: hypothetical protein VIV58_08230 [Kofleriaceae bacterium]